MFTPVYWTRLDKNSCPPANPKTNRVVSNTGSKMAKRVRDADLENRSARSKLKVQGKPYYKVIGPGLHVGYRKGKRAGMWVVRRYAGASSYVVETIAEADDYADSRRQREFSPSGRRKMQPGRWRAPLPALAVPIKSEMLLTDYLVELEGRASYADTKGRLEAYALPALGDKHVDKLTADMLRKWHRDLAKAPRRIRTHKGAAEHKTKAVDLDDPEAARRRKVSANRILGLLKAALNYAFTEGKAASDVEWRRVKPFKDVNQSRASYLTLAECKRLLNAADPEFPLIGSRAT